MLKALVQANRWSQRHRKLIAAVGAACFWIVCADYAGFVSLPDLITIPAFVTGILTGLRYALWEGWLRDKVEAESGAGDR